MLRNRQKRGWKVHCSHLSIAQTGGPSCVVRNQPVCKVFYVITLTVQINTKETVHECEENDLTSDCFSSCCRCTQERSQSCVCSFFPSLRDDTDDRIDVLKV